jgi:hypothetical protein
MICRNAGLKSKRTPKTDNVPDEDALTKHFEKLDLAGSDGQKYKNNHPRIYLILTTSSLIDPSIGLTLNMPWTTTNLHSNWKSSQHYLNEIGKKWEGNLMQHC